MTECISISPKLVMISGHFEGFHYGHLDYLEQAIKQGDVLICVISTDKQLMMKKGRVNMPDVQRARIVDLILDGLKFPKIILFNVWDTETTLVAKALKAIKPDILFRGYDKKPETMPEAERKVCQELGIEIIYAKNRIGERHSSEIFG